VHWLAVNGVQPTIPQNPSIAHQSKIDAALREWQTQHHAHKQRTAAAALAAAAAAEAAAAQAAAASDEPKKGKKSKDEKATSSGATAPTTAAATVAGLKATAVKHVLSKEQHLYYEQVTTAIKGTDYYARSAALKSIACDAGLHQLLPYLIHFIADEVRLHSTHTFTSSLMTTHTKCSSRINTV
jgi:transcription initiation factor TFIID subunit 6